MNVELGIPVCDSHVLAISEQSTVYVGSQRSAIEAIG
jgi:hypothetical protein